MKFLVLVAALTISPFASAYTFCTNSVAKSGANFIFLEHDKCPSNTSNIHGMNRLYTLVKAGDNSCVYHSSLTRKTGDEMYCDTHLSPDQVVRAIEKSNVRTPTLQHILKDLKRRFV